MDTSTPIRDPGGQVIGTLLVTRLPGRSDRLAQREDQIELAEAAIYRFEIDLGVDDSPLELEPSTELFSFDDSTCRTGRLQPREHVGRIAVAVRDAASGVAGTTQIDVAPTKLEYEHEYQQMLSDVAEVATDALLQGFGPAALALHSDSEEAQRLLYQQFAFLHAQLSRRELKDAVSIVLASPHQGWVRETTLQPPGRPLPGSSTIARSLARPGPRTHTSGRLRIPSIPVAVERSRTEATYDSPPNRFVKYALNRWRGIAQRLLDLLGAAPTEPGPVRRGKDVTRQAVAMLDRWLAAPLFREVGELEVFPFANQVLQKQDGYRQILRTFALTEVGARLGLDWAIDDAFAASQRNIATLYEYWSFLQLAEALGTVCSAKKTATALVESSDQLSLGFRQGKHSGVKWTTVANGRELDIELFFNRTFAGSETPSGESSWSRAMRPDCSVRVRPKTGLPQLKDPADLDIWLHFDAKYKVEYAREQFDRTSSDSEEAADQAEEVERVGRSRREDLLKMHAYRDAIRRSAGAYVLYPGTEKAIPFREYEELLPGLGAFALRPAESGTRGREELETFLGAAIRHAADRATQHERERYWRGVIRKSAPDTPPEGRLSPAISEPPRDAPVLCGFVRSRAHFEWIRAVGLYNIRAGRRVGALSLDSAELRSEWLLLYGSSGVLALWQREGPWFVLSRDDLAASGYPDPRGDAYLCSAVAPVLEYPRWIDRIALDGLRIAADLPRGHPFVVTWADLLVA